MVPSKILEPGVCLKITNVFLALSKEAANSSSWDDSIRTIVKYLPDLVDYDLSAALLESEDGKVLLTLHCRRSLTEAMLLEARRQVMENYQIAAGHRLAFSDFQILTSGERVIDNDGTERFASEVHLVLTSEGRTTGMLQLFCIAPSGFQPGTRELLHLLVNQTSEWLHGLRRQLSAERPGLELMIEGLADGVIMVDERDRIFVINTAARKLLNLAPETSIDTRYLKETLGFYPFDLIRGWKTGERAVVREEIKLGDRILHSVVSPVNAAGRLIGVAVLLRDISEEKMMEDRKEEFLSFVSHELRNPLTSIGGAIDLMLNRVTGEINEKQQRYLQLAKSGCERINLIIDDFADLRRFERGKIQLDRTRFDLGSFVRDVVENHRPNAEEKPVELKLETPAGPIWVEADRPRLHQVLNNLLANAIKFTLPSGHVQIGVFQSEATPGMLGISVFNDGHEIAEIDHQRIFDKFEQARSTRGPGISGSALGLSISKSIVEAHGGHIWVESGRGRGTRFIFTLPNLGAPEPRPITGPKASEVVALHFKSPPRVLVVDDDPNVTYMIKGSLMAQGFEVTAVHSGQEALRLARERLPDIMLMDIRMPELDGLQLTDILRHDPETREIPVVVMSGFGSEADAYRVGAQAYLKKPFSSGELLETLQRQLAARCQVRRKSKVLIVDDDAAIRSVCREILEKQGYAVAEAESGRQAFDFLARGTFDVILLDIILPDYDGFQVTERIRENRSWADVPIIFISARGKTADKIRALRAGGDDYLVKPFDALELGARVESAIKRKERKIDSSPNTRLPGSAALERELNLRLQSGKSFVLCYLDLDNLKPFNDYYGYAKADGVVQQTADLIRQVVEKNGSLADFVGHIAGDDFVLITEPQRIQTLAQEIIQRFDALIPHYYGDVDRNRGFIEAEDRFGQMRRFSIMSISVAAVFALPGQFQSPTELSLRAAEMKNKAKMIPGSVFLCDEPSKGSGEA